MTATAKSSYLKGSETLLHYIYREPKIKTAHPPVVILLHGVGSNEQDLFSFANELPDDFLVISARAPYTQGPGSYAWYHVDFSTGKPVIDAAQAEKSKTIIIQFLSQIQELHHFDARNVFLCGFSQGAIMSYSVGLTRPDRIKGIAPLSGRLTEEVKPIIKQSDKLKQLRVFIAHGSADNMLGIKYATDANAFLKILGLKPTFKEYPIGHEISKEELRDVAEWLSSESKRNE